MNVTRKKLIVLSIITIVLTMTVPIISMLNSIERDISVNELEHLIAQLQIGSIWSIYAVIGTLYLFVYWVIFFVKNKRNTELSY
ncbi:hypothetical protein ACIQAA_31925 [Neobacillus sp. NPDC093182]|uniref:hypothetical protein n=1 Tax=Neobacillus sp. NPDC093182 TaxID=3364297 RepID=UPI00381CA6C0